MAVTNTPIKVPMMSAELLMPKLKFAEKEAGFTAENSGEYSQLTKGKNTKLMAAVTSNCAKLNLSVLEPDMDYTTGLNCSNA